MKNLYRGSFVALTIILSMGLAHLSFGADLPVLRMSSAISDSVNGPAEDGSNWRYFETWQTDVARTDDGKLIHLDPYDPYVAFDPEKTWAADNANRKNLVPGKFTELPLKDATQIKGSAFPAADWMKSEFDDSTWFSTMAPMRMNYRSVALVCLRGKFTVNDPAKVTELNLDASYQGGAVVYVNGKEVGRFSLPQGKIDNNTLADDYPADAFFDAKGCPFVSSPTGTVNDDARILGEDEYPARVKDQDLQQRYKKRFRSLTLKIVPGDLKKGINVLAIEVHRAPTAAGMFSRLFPKETGYDLTDRYRLCWNRAGIESLSLTAKGDDSAISKNTSRPANVQVWNSTTTEAVFPYMYGDPNDKLAPIQFVGARNGAYSGQVVVSSPKPIKSLKAEPSDLKDKSGQTIAKSALQLRYPRFLTQGGALGFTAMESAVPAEVPALDSRGSKDHAALQPIWLTVQVPKDAKPGDYTGSLTVSAEGLSPTIVPIQLHVSNWTLPDPQDFQTYNAMVESPETLSLRYNVPMWSDEHWKLIDQSFQLMGEISTKDITIPLVAKSHFGNEFSMLRFEKQADGSYKPQFDIIEKYIDTAVKHLGKIPMVCFYIVEQDENGSPLITEIDPATKALKNTRAPAWGTPEAIKFWTPAFDGLRKILAKNGIEKSIGLGYHNNGDDGPVASRQCLNDCTKMVPEAHWSRLGHMFNCRPMDPKLSVSLDKGPGSNPWGRVALVIGGTSGVHWEPDIDHAFFGWLNPYPVIGYYRDTIVDLRDWRMAPEKILFAGMPRAQATWGMCDIAGMFGRDKFLGTKGLGPIGADYFHILKGSASNPSAMQPLCGRYIIDPARLWYTVGLTQTITEFLGEGQAGPVSTPTVENMREGLEDAEAHIYCQNALLDQNLKAKLGADLDKRCKEVCDDQVRLLHYRSEFSSFGSAKTSSATHIVYSPQETQDYSRKLYEMAAEVSKALGK